MPQGMPRRFLLNSWEALCFNETNQRIKVGSDLKFILVNESRPDRTRSNTTAHFVAEFGRIQIEVPPEFWRMQRRMDRRRAVVLGTGPQSLPDVVGQVFNLPGSFFGVCAELEFKMRLGPGSLKTCPTIDEIGKFIAAPSLSSANLPGRVESTA